MGPLIRWEPSMSMARLRDEMNRLLEDYFGETGEERTPAELVRVPSVDVLDREQDVLVRAEMPGIAKEGLQIQAMPESLMIRAEQHREEKEQQAHFIRHERRVSVFQRLIPMPAEIVPDEVKATYRDGILEVTLPKSEQAKTRRPVRVQIE